MDIVIEQVEAFTVMGLTYRFTDPSGGGAGKELLNDFAEEAKYYAINTDTTYAVTVEPSRVAGAWNWPPAKPSFYFTYGVAVRWGENGRYTAMVKISNLANTEIQNHVFGDILKRQITCEFRARF